MIDDAVVATACVILMDITLYHPMFETGHPGGFTPCPLNGLQIPIKRLLFLSNCQVANKTNISCNKANNIPSSYNLISDSREISSQSCSLLAQLVQDQVPRILNINNIKRVQYAK